MIVRMERRLDFAAFSCWVCANSALLVYFIRRLRRRLDPGPHKISGTNVAYPSTTEMQLEASKETDEVSGRGRKPYSQRIFSVREGTTGSVYVSEYHKIG